MSPSESSTGCAPGSAPGESAPPTKRRRLNLACNYCRSRKTRCDEQKPSCHACLAAGLECITTDPRRPNRHVERREAGRGPDDCALSSTGSIQTPERDSLQSQAANIVFPSSALVTSLESTACEHPHARLEEEHHPRPTSSDVDGSNARDRFRGLLPILKHEISSTSVDILTGWLNVATFRLGLGHLFAPPYPQPAAQHHIPFPSHIPSFPVSSDIQTWTNQYLRSTHPVYPIVDKDELGTTLELLQTHGIHTLISDPERLPQIVIALIVLNVGSSETTNTSSATGDIYVFVKDLVGRLIGRPTFVNIKALFLLALDMYHHDEVASAWSTLTLCISMMTAVGLGKSRFGFTTDSSHSREDDKRTWWSVFILERLIAFETGRRCSLSADDSPSLDDTVVAMSGQPEEQMDDDSFFRSVIGLATLLGEIGQRCIDVREREEVSGREELQQLVTEKVKITGASCLQLNKWAEALPDNLRPGSDLIYDRRTFPRAAFLSLHYHNAILVLTRNSLLISESALRDTTDVISKNQPWGHVIRNGQPMLASTARKLIKLLVEAEESETALLVPCTNAALHALYVLAVHLMRHPENMLRKADLELINQASRFAQARPHISPAPNPNPTLTSILTTISTLLTQPSRTNATAPFPTPHDPAAHPTNSSTFTLPDAPRLSDEELLTRFPQMDEFVDEALYCYGMDIGTWVGLGSVRWDHG